MRPSPVTRLMHFAWTLVPLSIGIFSVLIVSAPISVGGSVTGINLPLIVVYFWALYRPDLLPPWAIFLIGFFQDLLTGGPVGLWAMVYLLVYALMLTQRVLLLARGSGAAWMGFLGIALLAAFVAFVIASLYNGQTVSIQALSIQTGLTILAYFFVSPLLTFIQRRWMRQA